MYNIRAESFLKTLRFVSVKKASKIIFLPSKINIVNFEMFLKIDLENKIMNSHAHCSLRKYFEIFEENYINKRSFMARRRMQFLKGFLGNPARSR